MIVYAEIECYFYNKQSLKEKRSLLRRLVTQLRQKFNVAVTELDFHDLWQRTKLGIVTVSKDRVFAEQLIQEGCRMIDSYPELERTITHIEQR